MAPDGRSAPFLRIKCGKADRCTAPRSLYPPPAALAGVDRHAVWERLPGKASRSRQGRYACIEIRGKSYHSFGCCIDDMKLLRKRDGQNLRCKSKETYEWMLCIQKAKIMTGFHYYHRIKPHHISLSQR